MFENKKELADEPENTQMTPLSGAEDNAFAGLQSKVLDPSPVSSAGDNPENSHNKGGATATDPTEGEPEQDIDAQIFGSNAYLQSADVQYLQDMIEAAAILAAGDNLEDMDESDLAKIANPSLRARLKAAIDVKRSEESTAESLSTVEARRQAWDNGEVDCTVGNLKLNSRQVDGILKMMSDPQQRAKLVDKFSKDKNISKKDAEGQLEHAAKVLDIVRKKAIDPNAKLTPEEQKLYEDRDNPKYGDAIQLLKKEEANQLVEWGKENRTDKRATFDVAQGLRPSEFSVFSPAYKQLEGDDFAIKTKVKIEKDFSNAASAKVDDDNNPVQKQARPTVPTAASVAASASWG